MDRPSKIKLIALGLVITAGVVVVGVVFRAGSPDASERSGRWQPDKISTERRFLPEEITLLLEPSFDKDELERIVALHGGSTEGSRVGIAGRINKLLKFPGASLEALREISDEIREQVEGVIAVTPNYLPARID